MMSDDPKFREIVKKSADESNRVQKEFMNKDVSSVDETREQLSSIFNDVIDLLDQKLTQVRENAREEEREKILKQIQRIGVTSTSKEFTEEEMHRLFDNQHWFLRGQIEFEDKILEALTNKEER